MIHSPAVIAARFGHGRVLAISPHLERTAGLGSLVERAVLSAARIR